MIYQSPSNTQHFQLNYHRVREGPNWFMMYYKNIATCCLDVKDVKSRLGSAKSLDSSKNLYKWMEEMMKEYDSVGIEMEGRADTSFASEALRVASEENRSPENEDPTSNTKMVV